MSYLILLTYCAHHADEINPNNHNVYMKDFPNYSYFKFAIKSKFQGSLGNPQTLLFLKTILYMVFL